jgi:pyridinium-3,5-bisthiocarboxylic acid mononucleotide nickel chelatase
MRIAYLDCFAGIAGDMFLGALIDAGVPAEVLHNATAALKLKASLKIETVDRSGISSIKVHVLEGGELAEEKPSHSHSMHDDDLHQTAGRAFEQSHQPRTQHQHKTGHTHTHEHNHHEEDGHSHSHTHGRSLTEIRTLIKNADLHEAVKTTAIRAFELLGHSEAKIHNIPVDQIHFHEVGALDAIVDIVAASAGIHHLQIGSWYSSPINVGGGTIECAHGTFPVPAPATADLLRGFPTYSAHVQKELVTPTGAALLRVLNPTFSPQPTMRVDSIGYGAGTRNPNGFPNVLRLSIGESASVSQPEPQESQTVTVLETALDDSSPQMLAYVAEKALSAGALDVMLTPVIMKKGRPGTLLTVLCNPSDSHVFEQLLITETSTLGLRIRQDSRICLERAHVSVETPYGKIRMKIGSQAGEERNAAPEFEDCRAAAGRHGVPLKQVQQATIAAYRNKPPQ